MISDDLSHGMQTAYKNNDEVWVEMRTKWWGKDDVEIGRHLL